MSKADMDKIMAKLNTIEQKVTDTNTNLSTLQNKVDNLSTQLSNLKKEKDDLSSKVDKLTEKNKQLMDAVNNLEQYSRKNNVIINGIPWSENEDIKEIIHNLADKLQVDLNPYNICAAHRLQSRENKTPAIIVRFNDNETKSEMIRAAKRIKPTAKKLNFHSNDRIFIGDHLAKHSSNLIKIAKTLRAEGKVMSAWTFNGQVYVRKSESDEAQRITDEEQLSNFVEVIHDTESNKAPRKTRKTKK